MIAFLRLLLCMILLSSCGSELAKQDTPEIEKESGKKEVESDEKQPEGAEPREPESPSVADDKEEPVERIFIHPVEDNPAVVESSSRIDQLILEWPDESSENYYSELEAYWSRLGEEMELETWTKDERSSLSQLRRRLREELVSFYSEYFELSFAELDFQLRSLGLSFVGEEVRDSVVAELQAFLFLKIDRESFSTEEVEALKSLIDQYEDLVHLAREKAVFVFFRSLSLSRRKLDPLLELKESLEDYPTEKLSHVWARRSLNRIHEIGSQETDRIQSVLEQGVSTSEFLQALSRLDRYYRLQLPISERGSMPLFDTGPIEDFISSMP